MLAAPLHSLISHNDTVAAAELLSTCEAEVGYGHCTEPLNDTEDSHHQTSQWAYIHSVLGNEGKKAADVLPPQVVVVVSVAAGQYTRHLLFGSRARVETDKSLRLLSRGVLAYRRFG